MVSECLFRNRRLFGLFVKAQRNSKHCSCSEEVQFQRWLGSKEVAEPRTKARNAFSPMNEEMTRRIRSETNSLVSFMYLLAAFAANSQAGETLSPGSGIDWFRADSGSCCLDYRRIRGAVLGKEMTQLQKKKDRCRLPTRARSSIGGQEPWSGGKTEVVRIK
ncbi:hypothetical protein AtNW77_MTg0323361 (mitochondrion) [Arabidopsis thaliana]